ncbi:LacI family DNA-binding transcriptional regulator [Achromobacter sp. AONIH1]|uniref:LacI family DNA-binding transcriptional regulator n=1 Tax=Achromobacter sp. AONIH1 TaxID=1758194 RepID=UPI000CD2CFFF|nr:LacI family DNA-binding transcriptional regulator [Achromobacter sp. AONIH1]AUT49403.1 transcriptional regulator [Achromobacter sp. AONIH1]
MSDRHAPSSAPTHDDVLRLRPDAPPPAPRALPPAKPPRIEEVARLAGVSPITVSRALRQPEKVAKDKRERILQVVAQTGYASNPHARALRSGQSSVVAAFVSNIFSQQFALAVQGCAEVLEPQGYQLMVGQTSYSYAKETSMIASLRALRPAAVLFTGVIELEENRQSLRELGIPIMETWAYPRDPIDMLVGLSNYDAGFMAASHLAERGYRRVAFMARHGGRGELRRQGFAAAAAQRGLEVVAELAVDNPQTIADGRAALARLLSQGGKFDAVFCANDLLAVGAMFEARDRKLAVPRDLAVLGFGETDIAGEIQPGLTTIGVDSLDLGRRAGEMLLQRLGGGMPAHPHQVMPLRIHARASV